MREKRTDIDFSQHKHRIEIFSNSETGHEIRVDHLQVGNSNYNYVQFINTDRILTVTGDYGNWTFCRPFVPSKDGYVSDLYWIEKLRMSNYLDFDTLDMIENEDIPHYKVIPCQLLAIFDAFDEICRRLEEKEIDVEVN